METNQEIDDVFGPVISRYTRAQAIEDGILVDVEQGELKGMALEAGIKFPIAMTTTAFHEYVWPESKSLQDRLKSRFQDIKGRYWDVVWMLRNAIKSGDGGSVILFKFYCVSATGHKHPRPVTLKAVCGPNDDASPCITIMLVDED